MRLNEKALAARRRQRNLVGLIGVLALMLLSVASFKSYSDLRVGRGQEAELREQIAASEERLGALEHRLERLRRDPAMLERLAREELMMARPGEVVIVLLQEAAAVSGISGLFGAALGGALSYSIKGLVPPNSPLATRADLDATLVATIVISLVAVGIVSGVLPAIRAARTAPADALRAH